ncbi:hypothetical protein GQL56_16770 [Pseudomonas putida]|nr:hypothetical protein [Pseudomonas putida]
MLNKLLIFLSMECFEPCILPISNASTSKMLSNCARAEASRALAGKSNFYEIEATQERKNISKARLITELQKLNFHTEGVTYISYLLDIFDQNALEKSSINSTAVDSIDKLLRLEAPHPTTIFYSAIEKIHNNGIYSAHTDVQSFIETSLTKDSSDWMKRLQNPKLFDDIEDAIQGLAFDILGGFQLFSFFGSASKICTKEEVAELVLCLSDILQKEHNTQQILKKIIPALQIK